MAEYMKVCVIIDIPHVIQLTSLIPTIVSYDTVGLFSVVINLENLSFLALKPAKCQVKDESPKLRSRLWMGYGAVCLGLSHTSKFSDT
jgi:hypothetical protein